ncbi:MAG: hypothetical protein M3323_10080 [Actinomycetota bacterium]|nr:hypothetical protein [Actinomycetota bacterium]
MSYEIGAQNIYARVGQSADTGFVGICDPELQCTGFRIMESTSDVSGGTTRGEVTLEGVVCVAEQTWPCSENGVPVTGIVITKRVLDTPEPWVGPIGAHVNVCLWLMSPQTEPTGCNLPLITTPGTGIEDSGNLLERTPQDITFGT